MGIFALLAPSRGWRRIREDRRGSIGVEFAFALPVMLLITAGLVEVGNAINQTTAMQKSLRGAAAYAARHTFPLSTTVETEIENMVKYGDPAGGEHYQMSGWADQSSAFAIDTSSFNVTGQPVGGVVIPVLRLTASIPFQPLLGGLLPIPDFKISGRHEQPFIGN